MTGSNISLLTLPFDLLVDSILAFLPIQDLLSLSCTCRDLHSIIHQNEVVWKRRIEEDYRFPTHSTGRIAGFKTLYRKLTYPEVWVWGQNMHNRLGFSAEEEPNLLEPALVNFSEVPTPLRLRKAESIGMVDLQAGGWSFHGLDIHGNVWCWGILDAESNFWSWEVYRQYSKPSEEEPFMLRAENLPRFKAISCGRSHACGISDDGVVYEWHSWAKIAKLTSVPWETSTVVQICASWDFSALLSSDGVVYCWREPTNTEVISELQSQVGQPPWESEIVYDLNSGDRIIRCPSLPESSDGPGQNKIIKIACGEGFIICLTISGDVYKLDVSKIPGDPSVAQPADDTPREPYEAEVLSRRALDAAFRREQRTWEYLPFFCESKRLQEGLIDALPSPSLSENIQPKITHISAQYQTFVAYSVSAASDSQSTSTNNSFVFFGKKESSANDKPEILPQLQNRGVIQVALGDYHYVALLSTGQVLTWGSYSAGALGLGHSSNPHRKLRPIGFVAESPETVDEQKYELGTQLPTAVQSFTGTEHYLPDRTRAQDNPKILNAKKVPSRYVFLVAAAGWHTGCLAFPLDEEEDLDYGLGILEKDVEMSEPREDDNATPENWIRLPGFFHRIGFAGRFMRGGARGGLLTRQVVRPQVEPEDPEAE